MDVQIMKVGLFILCFAFSLLIGLMNFSVMLEGGVAGFLVCLYSAAGATFMYFWTQYPFFSRSDFSGLDGQVSYLAVSGWEIGSSTFALYVLFRWYDNPDEGRFEPMFVALSLSIVSVEYFRRLHVEAHHTDVES